MEQQDLRRAEEIKAEIAKLNPVDVRMVAQWQDGFEANLFDKQIEDDAAAGKLDRFIKGALC